MDRPKAKIVATKGKKWKELQSRRSFRSMNRVRAPNQYNQSSSMHDPPGVCENAKETSYEIFNNNLVDKRTLIEDNPKEIVESILGSYGFDEEYRKCGFDIQKSLDVCEEKEKRHDHGKKTVRWVDDDEKSRMDLGISEAERTKRLEGLMERRRSIRRNETANVSCGEISSLHIPKINPFLEKSSGDSASSLPGSAPSYVVKSNPFDLPYDPHEEKPILTGDGFEEEFMATNQKQKEPISCKHVRFSLGKFLPPETTDFGSDFEIKQLSSGKLVTSTVEYKEDDNKQPQEDGSIPNDAIGDYHAREEGESSEKMVNAIYIPDESAESESATKAADVVSIPDSVPDESAGTETYTKEESDRSSSTSSSSEDEPILRPNKEAILHCLSMSRMRVVSAKNNFIRHAESYDCGPSALFDKSKTDGFFFGGNKRIHYSTSTHSVASDMQVEVSEIGSPPSTNISSLDDEAASIDTEKGKGRLRDTDEESDQETTETGFSRWELNREPLESIMMPEKMDEQDGHYFTRKDRLLTEDTSSSSSREMDNEVPNQETTVKNTTGDHPRSRKFQEKNAFTRKDLDEIAEKLVLEDPYKGNWTPLSVIFKPHHNSLTGNYDINVLISAVEGKGKRVVWHDRRNRASSINLDESEGKLMGIVLNIPVKRYGGFWRSRHWVSLRRINGVWYNLDSDFQSPYSFESSEELRDFLDGAIDGGTEVLLVKDDD